MTRASHDIVFLIDVDNTLLDNDAVIEGLKRHLVAASGADISMIRAGSEDPNWPRNHETTNQN
jgi:hypothetical protein